MLFSVTVHFLQYNWKGLIQGLFLGLRLKFCVHKYGNSTFFANRTGGSAPPLQSTTGMKTVSMHKQTVRISFMFEIGNFLYRFPFF
jgi:hypothetical protein